MYKILLSALAAMMALCASAQETIKKIRVYEGNSVAYERVYDAVDSVVFVDVTYHSVTTGPLQKPPRTPRTTSILVHPCSPRRKSTTIATAVCPYDWCVSV